MWVSPPQSGWPSRSHTWVQCFQYPELLLAYSSLCPLQNQGTSPTMSEVFEEDKGSPPCPQCLLWVSLHSKWQFAIQCIVDTGPEHDPVWKGDMIGHAPHQVLCAWPSNMVKCTGTEHSCWESWVCAGPGCPQGHLWVDFTVWPIYLKSF